MANTIITIKTYKNAFNYYEAKVSYKYGMFDNYFRKDNKNYNALCKEVLDFIRDDVKENATIVFEYLGDRIFVD